MILLSAIAWKRFTPVVKAYVMTSCLLLLAYISFYARYFVWSGDFAWGDRYVSTTVELAALLSVPLLLRHRGTRWETWSGP
jgi:phosphatidylglycerophosphate synthase